MTTRKLPPLFTRLAVFASEAADQANCSRDYRSLIEAIEENERAHRRMIPTSNARSFPVKDAVSYFVIRTLSDAYRMGPEAPIRRYVGTRDDYLRAALLAANPAWREAFERILVRAAQNGHIEIYASPAALLEYVSNLASYEVLAS